MRDYLPLRSNNRKPPDLEPDADPEELDASNHGVTVIWNSYIEKGGGKSFALKIVISPTMRACQCPNITKEM